MLGVGASTETRWVCESPDDGLRVETQWGAPGDAFDPVTPDRRGHGDDVRSGPQGNGEVVERRQRRCTANEFDALVRASGVFAIVDWLALAPPIAFGNEPGRVAHGAVLRKRAMRN